MFPSAFRMTAPANTDQQTAAELLRRSLARGRLGHAYLFLGDDLAVLGGAATRLAQTLNCVAPTAHGENGVPLDPCGQCQNCSRITRRNHPDVVWVRPEMKSRVIGADQTREVIRILGLRAAEAPYKVSIFAGADRMNASAANAFLKTLEEPPAGCVIILLCTEPDRLLETIISRCLRLRFASGIVRMDEEVASWVGRFAELARLQSPPLFGRYQLLGSLLTVLNATRERIGETLSAQSPLRKYPDAEAAQQERWEEELKAAVEAEYRCRRGEFAAGLQAWLRDVWLGALGSPGELSFLPELAEATGAVASRLQPDKARRNLDSWEKTQRLLYTNAQEALVLEVGLIRLIL
jgi:DNA polymerase-3 subunit delta'